ncbi:MAG: hypothetical protein RhofKO_31030 [Rhodothermales bacterium]
MTPSLPPDDVLRALVEHATDVMAVHDSEGRYVYISPSITQMLGYKPDELLGQLPSETIHPDDVARLQKVIATHFNIAEAQRPNTIRHVRYRKRCKDGSYLWVSTSNRAIRDERGQLTFSVSAIRDVTAIIEAEQVLAESEERWRSLVEHFPEPIILSNFDSDILYTNEAGLRLLDAPSAEAVYARKTHHFLHPSHHATAAARIEQLRRTERLEPVLYQLIGFSARPRYAEFVSVPITYRGQPAIQHVARDVTEAKKGRTSQRRLAKRLRMLNGLQRRLLEGQSLNEAAQHTLEALYELVPFARANIRLVDPDKQVASLYVAYNASPLVTPCDNVLTLDELGFYLPDGSIRTRALHVTHLASHADSDPFYKSLQYVYGVGSFIFLPLLLGGVVHSLLNVFLPHEQGFSNEHLDILYDVADLLAIGIKHDRLEHDRKAYEAELIDAREQALEMSRLKSTFLANMSHEIRTPLTAIIGFSDILALNDTHADNREFARLIRQSGQRLLDTLNSVLDLAQLEGDMVPIDRQWVDVREVAEGVAEMLRPRLTGSPVTLQIAPEDPVPLDVFSDFGALQRILINLTSNAIKFTAQGEIWIDLNVASNTLTIQVRDTGIGIPDQFLPHLFAEFRQASSGVSRDYEGSGLGLTITKRLVELLEGRIDVTSQMGVGTTFTVTLPYGHLAQGVPPSGILHEPFVSYRPRLLIVAPETSERTHLAQRLHTAYQTDEAARLADALALTTDHLYDVILFDPALAGSSPETTIDILRSQPDYSRVPIIGWPPPQQADNRLPLPNARFDAYLHASATPADLRIALLEARASSV